MWDIVKIYVEGVIFGINERIKGTELSFVHITDAIYSGTEIKALGKHLYRLGIKNITVIAAYATVKSEDLLPEVLAYNVNYVIGKKIPHIRYRITHSDKVIQLLGELKTQIRFHAEDNKTIKKIKKILQKLFDTNEIFSEEFIQTQTHPHLITIDMINRELQGNYKFYGFMLQHKIHPWLKVSSSHITPYRRWNNGFCSKLIRDPLPTSDAIKIKAYPNNKFKVKEHGKIIFESLDLFQLNDYLLTKHKDQCKFEG